MAKRFTDTEKWKSKFIRSLPSDFKLFWFYILDDCDHAGIWIVDFEVAILRLGIHIDLQDAVNFFSEKIVILENGEKWFIPSFVELQYPSGLNPTNKAHAGVIQILTKYSLIDNNFKPLPSPFQGAKEKDKDKEKEMEGKGGMGENPLDGTQLVPTLCRNWYARFPTYSQDNQLDFHAVGKIVAFMCRQYGVRDVTDPETFEKILSAMDQVANQVAVEPFWINKPLSSIANAIQEFFNKINNPQHAKQKQNLADNSRPGRKRTAL